MRNRTVEKALVAYDTALLNGIPLTNTAPVVHAFWWVDTEEAAAESLDVRAHGDMWVELRSFWDSAAAARVRAAGITGEVAQIEMRQTDSTTWVMHLVLPDADVRATCRLRGAVTPADYPLPAYTTIWAPGTTLGQFTLYTYYGHMNQACDAEIVADDAGPLASSLRNGIEIQKALGGRVRSGGQFAWRAPAGVYQH